jgi:hypothetical protein
MIHLTFYDRIAKGDDGGAIIGIAQWMWVPRVDDTLVLDEREYEVRDVVWKAKSSMQATGGEKFYNALPSAIVTVVPSLKQMDKDKAEGKW